MLDSEKSVAQSPRIANDAKRVLLFGATGTIGQATARALLRRGHEVVCIVRPAGTRSVTLTADAHPRMTLHPADVTDRQSVLRDGLRGEQFDAVISCMASRTGVAADAWAIDHRAQGHALTAAQQARAGRFILLSAICVQKPILAFQQAKLAFERELADSGVPYSIVRPTAFFKSLSGQVERVRRGKPFMVFGDGTLTACKPIGDDDLGDYLADCLDDDARRNRILPIGGPGPAITPRQQGEHLFSLLGKPPRFKQVPVGLLDGIVRMLTLAGRVSPAFAAKAELARIGRYYATESMLVLDPATGCYDAAATPSTGTQTLLDHYARLVRREITTDLGDHAVF
jgi:divinyl chlorophyllide a 8-vinyl-reductase